MKAAELKEILRTAPDDVDIDFQLQTEVPKEKLEQYSYKCPYDYEPLQYAGHDCGYSSGTLIIYVLGEARMKCDCYDTKVKREYAYSITGGEYIAAHDYYVGICNGTREQDECSCGGDRTKCTFYPEVRKIPIQHEEF